jgi:hypothetical protein
MIAVRVVCLEIIVLIVVLVPVLESCDSKKNDKITTEDEYENDDEYDSE